jgi:prepilin-type N-terminal cleavage/methylation domain-containing protein
MFTDHSQGRKQGFTLFEIILALLILTVSIIPMINAFAPALLSAGSEEERAVLAGRARQTINRVWDMDFRALDAHRGNPVDLAQLFGSAAEANKETVLFRVQTYVPVVSITDASGGQGGLLELQVRLQTVQLQTRKAAH